MLEFVNDPQFDGLPLVGEGHVLVAVRTQCGRAARWVPGGDVVALAEFLGPSFPVVGERLFEQRSDGSLFPVDLSSPFWVLVPPAGEPVMYGPKNVTSVFAQVVNVDTPSFTAEQAQAWKDRINAKGAGNLTEYDHSTLSPVPDLVVKAMSDGGPSTPNPVISGPGVAAAFAAIVPPAKVEPAKKSPGRPKKETPGV